MRFFSSTKEKIVNGMEKNFSLDSRALSLFRVGVGVLSLIDLLFIRGHSFSLLYTNNGMIPMDDLVKSFKPVMSPSLNLIYHGDLYQFFLYLCSIVVSFLFMIGYKTKWNHFWIWILTASFIYRNPIAINSADILFVLMIFWSFFCPVGNHFSVDRALDNLKKKPSAFSHKVCSVASMAFIMQLIIVYLMAYQLKTGPEWRQDGSAVYYALNLDMFRTDWGDILLQYPLVMKALTYVSYYVFEGMIPLIFLLFGGFWKVRVFIVFLMIFFHLNLGLFLWLGLFSWVCVLIWLALLPSEFWDGLYGLFKRWKQDRGKLYIYYDGACDFCIKSVALLKSFLLLSPHVVFKDGRKDAQARLKMEQKNSWLGLYSSGQDWKGGWMVFVEMVSYSPFLFVLAPLLKMRGIVYGGEGLYRKISRHRHRLSWLLSGVEESSPVGGSRFVSILSSVFVYFCFLYVVGWNIRMTNFDYYKRFMPYSWNGFGHFFHITQYWGMFAPKPMMRGIYIMLPAETQDGRKIDLQQGGAPFSEKKTENFIDSIANFRERKLFENITIQSINKNNKIYIKRYLNFMCRKWNKKQKESGGRIKNVEYVVINEKIPPPGEVSASAPKLLSQAKVTCP